LIYVNSEDTAEVVVFDPKSLEIKKRCETKSISGERGASHLAPNFFD